jgi:hypothetical protein
LPPPLEDNPERISLWLNITTGMELDDAGEVHVLDAETWHQRHRRLEQLGGPPMQ